jgi:lysozyme family protein
MMNVKLSVAGLVATLIQGTKEWYAEAYQRMSYDKGFESGIAKAALRCWTYVASYEKVARAIGCPWYFVAAIHNMEASGNFEGVLHNGQKIIGKGKKTTIVPKGRGPFKTWEEAAIDALRLKRIDKVKDWSIGNMLKIAEAYNGLGYLKYHKRENSPYLWAQTSINDGNGKYASDGKWSEAMNANGQVGFAAIVKELERTGRIKVQA